MNQCVSICTFDTRWNSTIKGCQNLLDVYITYIDEPKLLKVAFSADVKSYLQKLNTLATVSISNKTKNVDFTANFY